MKLTKSVHLLAIGLVLLFAATGCKTRTPSRVTPLPGAKAGTPGDVGPGDTLKPGTGPGEGDNVGSKPMAGPDTYANYDRNAEIFKSDTVYFDLDSSAIKSSEKSKVAGVADHLKSNNGTAVEIDG